MKNMVPAEALGDASEGISGDGLSLRQALFREQHSYGLMVTDSDGTISDWNPAAARIFGYSAEEVLGKTPSMFHRADERPALTASILASVERDGYWAGETPIVRKDGSEGIPVWASRSPSRWLSITAGTSICTVSLASAPLSR